MKGLTASETAELLMSVATHRTERLLTPIEVAARLQRAVDAGLSADAVGHAVGLDAKTVHLFLRLLELPDDYRQYVSWGRAKGRLPMSSASEAVELRGLLVEADFQLLLDLIRRDALKHKEVRAVVQRVKRNSAKPWREHLNDVLSLRPQVERQELIILDTPGLEPKDAKARADSLRFSLKNLLNAGLLAVYASQASIGILVTPTASQELDLHAAAQNLSLRAFLWQLAEPR